MSANIYDLNVANLKVSSTFLIDVDPVKIGINAGKVAQGSYSGAIGYETEQFNQSIGSIAMRYHST